MVRGNTYEANPGINISRLKLLAHSPSHFQNAVKDEEEQEPAHFVIGSAVEEYMCYGKDAFHEKYHVFTCLSPTGMLRNYALEILKGATSEEAYINVGYNPKNIGIKKVEENFAKYDRWQEEMKTIGDKIPLTTEQYSKILSAAVEVLTNRFTSDIFRGGEYQKELYWNEDAIACKALPDIVHEYPDKIVLTDIKTSSQGILFFDRTILKYRYDLQAAWYCRAVEQLYNKPCEFRFLAVDVAYRQSPIVYNMTEKALKNARFGFTAKSGYKYKGWQKLLEDYAWHMQNNLWDYSRDIYESRGIVMIDEL